MDVSVQICTLTSFRDKSKMACLVETSLEYANNHVEINLPQTWITHFLRLVLQRLLCRVAEKLGAMPSLCRMVSYCK